MYNIKDIQFVGKYDFDKISATKFSNGTNIKTFSIGIFKWEMKSKSKEMKRSKSEVRVTGSVNNRQSIFDMAENVVKLLDSNEWDGRKTVIVK
jgi:hypothetical protein